MAKFDLTGLSTLKLRALYRSASEEDKTKIRAILDDRNAYTEDRKAVQAAEEKANPVMETRRVNNRMTDEESQKLSEHLKRTVMRHRCRVVPFDSVVWEDGTIAGVIIDKKTNKVLLAIKLDDGRRIVKTWGSKLLQVSDDVSEDFLKYRRHERPWTDTEKDDAVVAASVNVGKRVKLESNGVEKTGRIVAVIPEPRTHKCNYRILIDDTEGAGIPAKQRLLHRVTNSDNLKIEVGFDEDGARLNESYLVKRRRKIDRRNLTTGTKVELANNAVEKAKQAYEKAKASLEAKMQILEAAKEEHDSTVVEQDTLFS